MTPTTTAIPPRQAHRDLPDPSHARPSVLTRLDADLLPPARLAGPHAWHPWGLTRQPPRDTQIRLVVPPGPNSDRHIERIAGSLHEQLSGPTWPPGPRLHVETTTTGLTCSRDGNPIARITIEPTSWERGGLPTATGDVLDERGWPILDQLAALNDRIHSIDPTHPHHADLDDLGHWVEQQMTGRHRPGQPPALRALLDRQHALTPRAADRLATILKAAPRAEHQRLDQQHTLDYLQAQVNAASSRARDTNRRPWARTR